MSEIKYININDDRFWQILFDEACVEGKQAERIQRELEKISINEKEIIRKPMQEIVERLETIYEFYDEKKKEAYDDKDWEYFDLNMHINRGVYEALAIVRKVGGMND